MTHTHTHTHNVNTYVIMNIVVVVGEVVRNISHFSFRFMTKKVLFMNILSIIFMIRFGSVNILSRNRIHT